MSTVFSTSRYYILWMSLKLPSWALCCSKCYKMLRWAQSCLFTITGSWIIYTVDSLIMQPLLNKCRHWRGFYINLKINCILMYFNVVCIYKSNLRFYGTRCQRSVLLILCPIYTNALKTLHFQTHHYICHTNSSCSPTPYLTFILLMWNIWWAANNASSTYV
jgi:hypothetical protein